MADTQFILLEQDQARMGQSFLAKFSSGSSAYVTHTDVPTSCLENAVLEPIEPRCGSSAQASPTHPNDKRKKWKGGSQGNDIPLRTAVTVTEA